MLVLKKLKCPKEKTNKTLKKYIKNYFKGKNSLKLKEIQISSNEAHFFSLN
jgi:hypothetical protein